MFSQLDSLWNTCNFPAKVFGIKGSRLHQGNRSDSQRDKIWRQIGKHQRREFLGKGDFDATVGLDEEMV